MQRINDFVIGMLLSITSWEVWQNIVISLIIAFLGGFMAAAGRALHHRVTRKKESHEDN